MRRENLTNREVQEEDILVSSEEEIVVSTESEHNHSSEITNSEDEIYYQEVAHLHHEDEMEEDHLDDVQSTESYFQEHVFTYRNFEVISSDESVEREEGNCDFPHLSENNSKESFCEFNLNQQVTAGTAEEVKNLYLYLLSLTNEGKLSQRIGVTQNHLFKYSIRNFDFLTERLEEISKAIKFNFTTGNRQFSMEMEFLISNELEIINFQNQRIFGTVIKNRINDNSDNLASYFTTEVKENSSIYNRDSVSPELNPITVFNYINNDQIVELRMIFKILLIIWNHKFRSLLNELMKYEFPLDSRKFVEKIFFSIKEVLESKQIKMNFFAEEKAGKVSLNETGLILSEQKKILLQTIRYKCSHKWSELNDLIEIIRPGTFFESQFSIFILLYLFYGDITLIRWLISSTYTENCYNQYMQKNYSLRDLLRIFKEVSFEKVESSTNTTSCVICLGDFTKETKVLKLYCKHVYHSKYLGDWLKDNNYCPFCKEKIASYRFMKSNCKIRNVTDTNL